MRSHALLSHRNLTYVSLTFMRGQTISSLYKTNKVSGARGSFFYVRLLLLVVEPSGRRRSAWLLIAHCTSFSFSNLHAHDCSSRCGRKGFRGFQQFTRFRCTLNSMQRVGLHHRRQNVYLHNQRSIHSFLW